MNNFERIKQMSIEEMAEMLADEIGHGDCCDCHCVDCSGISCKEAFYIWLEEKQK